MEDYLLKLSQDLRNDIIHRRVKKRLKSDWISVIIVIGMFILPFVNGDKFNEIFNSIYGYIIISVLMFRIATYLERYNWIFKEEKEKYNKEETEKMLAEYKEKEKCRKEEVLKRWI